MTPREALKKYFGYENFRPGQEEIITSIINNENLLAVLPTGAGKSLCYQLPAILGKNYSIVISPLIALMKDQVDLINKEKRLAAFINSSLDFSETQKVLNDTRLGKIKLLFVSPERLANISFLEVISENQPDYLFVDEAHCISEWGHNFRPSYREINNFINKLAIKNLSAFTATATPEVRTDILTQLNIPESKIVVRGFERENISIEVLKTRQKKEKAELFIKKFGSPAIIYTASRKQAEEVDEYLKHKGYKSAYYHAGLASGLRTIIQDDFINDRIEVICATNAFGMGIDKPDIRTIIHYSIPASIENYYQEIGRAGRDGNESKALLFYDPKDKFLQEFLINSSYPTPEVLITIYNSLFDYSRVAVGSIREDIIDLKDNFYLLIANKNIKEIVFNSALKILENSGYLEVISGYDQSYSFTFTLSADQLHSYVKQIANNPLKELIITLLKKYGGNAFRQRVNVNFNDLASLLGTGKEEIKENMMNLSSSGIIEYEIPTSNIRIRFLKTRLHQAQLSFSDRYEQLRKNAISKLDRMIGFVELKNCRFKYILNYFGEYLEDYECGKCDKCSGLTSSDSVTFEYLEEIMLNTLHEADNKLSSRDLINALTGHSPSGRLKNLSSFGTCVHFSKDELKITLESLINKEFVGEMERYLYLTEQGKNYFTETFRIIEEDISDSKDKSGSLELFHQLIRIRKDIGKKYSQPPEIICGDDILRRISEVKPTSPSALQEIEGVNQRMFNKLGEDILFAVSEYIRREEKKNGRTDLMPANLESTLALIKKGYNLDEISSLLKLSDHLISIQIESILSFEPGLDVSKLLTKKEFETIEAKIDEGFEDIKKLKNNLPESFSYSKIRIVLSKRKYS